MPDCALAVVLLLGMRQRAGKILDQSLSLRLRSRSTAAHRSVSAIKKNKTEKFVGFRVRPALMTVTETAEVRSYTHKV